MMRNATAGQIAQLRLKPRVQDVSNQMSSATEDTRWSAQESDMSSHISPFVTEVVRCLNMTMVEVTDRVSTVGRTALL